MEQDQVCTLAQLKALAHAFDHKCDIEKKRQIFFYGFCLATKTPFSEIKKKFGSLAQRPSYKYLINDLKKKSLKKPKLSDLPLTWINYYNVSAII